MYNKVIITNPQQGASKRSHPGFRILIRRGCNAVLEFEHFDGSG